MKYIRTKDGIFEVLPNQSLDEKIIINTEVGQFFKKEIIEEADTIEELCDEFVGVNDNEYQLLRAIPYKCHTFWNKGVYGAIWTSKGLIYVAKMNDNGELELI